MDPHTAAANLIADFPGGIEAMAPRCNKTPAVLRNEINPHCTGSKLGLMTAWQMTMASNNPVIAQSLSVAANGFFLRLPNINMAIDMPTQVAQVTKEFGDYLSLFCESISDGVVTDNELSRLQKEFEDLFRTALNTFSVAQKANAELRARLSPLGRVA